ncbi:BrnT family toxin [bacterium]|nr:BrnT family toxin [bacterium]NBX82250.1 BrnT family toxin [bacterium]
MQDSFSWDASKAHNNLLKHGVSFEEAATLFFDGSALEWPDNRHSHAELRIKRVGCSAALRVLILVYTLRKTPHDQEIIRIISARKASRKETKAYLGLLD